MQINNAPKNTRARVVMLIAVASSVLYLLYVISLSVPRTVRVYMATHVRQRVFMPTGPLSIAWPLVESPLLVEVTNTRSSYNSAGTTLPIRLIIPRIHIDAPIEHVGLTSDGAMDAPSGPVTVAWYSLGARPGEQGSAVIAGHYGWYYNASAVFDDLHLLQVGDIVYTKNERSETSTFVVRKIEIYGKNDDASLVFGSSDGKAHLNLITCTGAWIASEQTRSERLIVFADKQ